MSSIFLSNDVIAELGFARTVERTTEIFRNFVRQFSIDTFTSGEVDIENRKRNVFHSMEWPDRWRNYYFQSGMIQHDPLVEALATQDGPFTWTDLRNRRALSLAGTEALNKVAAEGWMDGLVVPIHRSGSHYGLISLVALNRTLSEKEKVALSSVCLIYHERMRILVPREGFRIPPAGLTPREIECVGLIARGLSDLKAGQVLGISGSTMHEHAERAKRKLDARNRAELAALAVAFGIVAV